MKKYQIIYADPPWRYGINGQYVEPSRAIERKYPTMSLEEIKEIKVPAEENSVLFLWTTTAKLSESLEVMKEWGFFYKSSIIWDKVKMGMGFWSRGQHEILLIGVRGKFSPPPKSMRIRSIYKEERKEHSEKPTYFRDLISKWYPNKTKLELFARSDKKIDLWGKNTFDGWDVWGDEVKSDIELKSK